MRGGALSEGRKRLQQVCVFLAAEISRVSSVTRVGLAATN
jgi:hypothetical protein